MPKAEALAKAFSILGPGTLMDGAYSWVQHGWTRPYAMQTCDHFDTWRASLEFDDKGRVSDIQISCDGPN